jgi:hypothetical protein
MNELKDNKLPLKHVLGTIKDQDIQISRSPNVFSEYKIVNYTITDGMGAKRYMSSLVFNEVYVCMRKGSGDIVN